MIKQCRICGKEFETITNGGGRQFCFDCVPLGLDAKQRTIYKRQAAKIQAVKQMGGKCLKCGENRPYVLAFHHLDPSQKEGVPAHLLSDSKFEEFFEEIKKTIPLCLNCHQEFHYLEANEGMTIEEYLGQALEEFQKIDHFPSINRTYTKKDCVCEQCGAPISRDTKHNLCSTCYSLSRRTTERPAPLDLIKMVAEKGFEAVGRDYNVTGNAIKKWLKGYDLPYLKSDILKYVQNLTKLEN